MESTKLGQLLMEADLITEEQLEKALAKQAKTGLRLGSTLVAMGFIDENLLATFLSMQSGVPCVSLLNVFPSPGVLELIPRDVARRTGAIPIKRVDDALHVAMTDPTDPRSLQEISQAAGQLKLRIVPLIAPAGAIGRALQAYYPRRRRHALPSPVATRSDLTPELEAALVELEAAAGAMKRAIRRLRDLLGASEQPE